jgi:hypothetical protein
VALSPWVSTHAVITPFLTPNELPFFDACPLEASAVGTRTASSAPARINHFPIILSSPVVRPCLMTVGVSTFVDRLVLPGSSSLKRTIEEVSLGRGNLRSQGYLSGETISLSNCDVLRFRRTPPRRPAFAGRLVVLVCILVCLSAGPATPARAYVCAPSSAHAPRVAPQQACERPRALAWQKHGDADAMSFVFFIGAVCAVLLIPVAFGRREELSPE